MSAELTIAVAFSLTGILLASLLAAIFYRSWKKAEKRASYEESLADKLRKESADFCDLMGKQNRIIDDLDKEITQLKEAAKPKPISAPISPDWLSSDILSLRKFLNDESGRKMMQRGRAISFANAIAGSNDQFHTVHSAGRTAGFSEALNWIESCASDQMLSRVTGVQATKQNTSDSEQDDAALLERFSP